MADQLAVYKTPQDLKNFLEKGKGVIAAALPRHLNPDRMLRLALTAFSTTPKLRECTGQSILASIVVASQMGLEINVAGQGYLIPYKSTCTFVPGWRGLVSLLNNTGRATAWTGVVCDGDEWTFELGSHPQCRHVPGPNHGDPEKMIWAYGCAQVNGSEHPVIEAWRMARVWAHRDRFNKVGQQHYSFQHPEMYARKVVLLQVLKYMPMSIELANAVTASDAAEMGRATRVEDGVVVDIDTESNIPEANVGKTRQPAGRSIREQAEEEQQKAQEQPASTGAPTTTQADAQSEAGERTAAAEKSQEAKKPAGPKAPTANELRTTLINRGGELNAGKIKMTKTLIALKLMTSDESIEKLDADRLATILDSWDQVKDAILNPLD